MRKPLELADQIEQPMKIYIGGLENLADISESDLKNIFSSFGDIESIEMPRDAISHNIKGSCYILYRKASQAKAAIAAMEGFKYKGKLLKVGTAKDDTRNGRDHYYGGDEDDSHLHNTQSKHALMQKLNRDVPIDINPSLGAEKVYTQSIKTGIPSVSQSSCVLLSNLFDPSTVDLKAEPYFYMETKEDVTNECSNYGKVEKVLVDESSTGNVWVKFSNNNWQAARAAVEGLNGRWFASRAIVAHLVAENVFDENAR